MTDTLELPQPLTRELEATASRIGVPVDDHATLLLYVATALLQEPGASPFNDAVLRFVDEHALDADRVREVLLALLDRAAIQGSGFGSTVAEAEEAYRSLQEWRNSFVHGRFANQRAPEPRPSAYGKYAHVRGSVDEFIARKQEEIELEDRRRS
jgi:hypothetical protein